MPVEFLGIGATNDGSETRARTGPSFDKDFTIEFGREVIPIVRAEVAKHDAEKARAAAAADRTAVVALSA